MKNTLVIGTGFLGRVVVTQLSRQSGILAHTYRTEPYFPDSVQLDLFQKSPSQVLSLVDIDTVIFCSHLENTPEVEVLESAMSKAFTDCADKRVIYVSTDAVFEGTKGNYLEADTASPVTVYGKNKKKCEELLAEIVPNYCIIRPSYIYGYSLGELKGRLAEARDLLTQKKQVKKFTDMFKSPIEVNRLAEIILAVAVSDYRGIIHAKAERVSVYDFFRRALTTLNADTNLLLPDKIPQDASAESLKDTSLSSNYLEKVFGFKPLSIEESLSRGI